MSDLYRHGGSVHTPWYRSHIADPFTPQWPVHTWRSHLHVKILSQVMVCTMFIYRQEVTIICVRSHSQVRGPVQRCASLIQVHRYTRVYYKCTSRSQVHSPFTDLCASRTQVPIPFTCAHPIQQFTDAHAHHSSTFRSQTQFYSRYIANQTMAYFALYIPFKTVNLYIFSVIICNYNSLALWHSPKPWTRPRGPDQAVLMNHHSPG